MTSNPPPAAVDRAVAEARKWEKNHKGDDLSDLVCDQSAELEDEDCDDTAIWAYAHGCLARDAELERLRGALRDARWYVREIKRMRDGFRFESPDAEALLATIDTLTTPEPLQ